MGVLGDQEVVYRDNFRGLLEDLRIDWDRDDLCEHETAQFASDGWYVGVEYGSRERKSSEDCLTRCEFYEW